MSIHYAHSRPIKPELSGLQSCNLQVYDRPDIWNEARVRDTQINAEANAFAGQQLVDAHTLLCFIEAGVPGAPEVASAFLAVVERQTRSTTAAPDTAR